VNSGSNPPITFIKEYYQKISMEKLNPKIKGEYDGLINDIRTELDVPMNRSLLTKIAIEGYLAKRTKPNGEYDLKVIAEPVFKMREQLKAERALKNIDVRLAKLKEKQAALEKLKSKVK